MSHESPLSINYDKLESLLSAGQWKEADQETNQLLEKIETVESRKREQDSKFCASSTSIFGRSNRKLDPVLDDAELTFDAQALRGHLPSFIKRTKSGQFGIASLKQLANSMDFQAIHSGKGLWDLRQILERLQ